MSSSESERLDLRLTPSQKGALVSAAAIAGRSISDFSVQTLVDRAEEVIQRDREVRVEAEAFDQIVEILERPAHPNEGLSALLARKTQFMEGVLHSPAARSIRHHLDVRLRRGGAQSLAMPLCEEQRTQRRSAHDGHRRR